MAQAAVGFGGFVIARLRADITRHAEGCPADRSGWLRCRVRLRNCRCACRRTSRVARSSFLCNATASVFEAGFVRTRQLGKNSWLVTTKVRAHEQQPRRQCDDYQRRRFAVSLASRLTAFHDATCSPPCPPA